MNSSAQERRNMNKVLKELLNAQERGVLQGVNGRLGDLGSINQQYDVAVSTAAEHQLGYIVVDTVTQAEAAVAYLKQSGIGSATFCCLDKMQAHEPARTKPFQAPPNSHRLFDLVQSKDQKFLNAFYFALKDTLVANDIKIASDIAFKNAPGEHHGRRHRVVTLRGEIIEASGVMSGGGRPPRGLMSNKIIEEFSEEDIRRVTQTITDLEQKHQ